MRTSIAVLCLCLLLLPLLADAQALNDKDIAKLVDDYCAENCSESRRAEIELKLLRVKPSQTTKPIKSALGNDKKREAALNLAVRLWTPGVTSAVKKYTDGDLCSQIVNLTLQRQEKEAVEHLLERWKAASPDSAEFAAITDGFKGNFLDLPFLDKLKAMLDKETDDARKSALGEILCFQLGINGTTAQDVLDSWNSARDARNKDGKRFTLEGRDLSVLPAFKRLGVKNCGSNLVLTAEGSTAAVFQIQDASNSPKEITSGNWKLTVRVFARSDACEIACYVGTLNGINSSGPVFYLKAKKWSAPYTNGESSELPAKSGTWTALSFVVKEAGNAEGNGKQQLVNLLVDGKLLGDKREFPGKWNSMGVRVTQGEAVISSFELTPE
ncbi:MAG: hypothetical protein KBG84_08750 [Planctomycetes bacterium]|nr:hypothetical protein [Planctomycetota bacterium]